MIEVHIESRPPHSGGRGKDLVQNQPGPPSRYFREEMVEKWGKRMNE